MAEAQGSLVIKLPGVILNQFKKDLTEVSWDLLNDIAHAANVENLEHAVDEDISHIKGKWLDTEGSKINGEYALIWPFSDEWMDVMRALVNKGNGIEVYGGIFHEYGATEFYALTATGERYIGLVDQEADDNVDPVEVQRAFLKMVPEHVKQLFPETF